MFNLFKRLNPLRKFDSIVTEINKLSGDIEKLDKEVFLAKTKELKEKIAGGENPDRILPEAFALCREAAARTLHQRHYDVQLLGGIILAKGNIAEMRTGEGKTLTATLPVYFNALFNKGVHVVTVNDYLARRDAVWMGQVYHYLGLSVGCIVHDEAYLYDPIFKGNEDEQEDKHDKERDTVGGFKIIHSYLRPVSRKEAYAADVTYGTNNEYGFDYLKDNMVYALEQKVQREKFYAIVDEVDSILIDEARTPLIISSPDTQSPGFYKKFAQIVGHLVKETDFTLDEKSKSVLLTETGIDHAEELLGQKGLFENNEVLMIHYLEEALKAQFLFAKDKDYIVKNNEVVIVDQFTGRLMPGRRYSEGLHQAIEAKENVEVQPESKTLATISFQNYFKLYKKLAGMTGTAATSGEEFKKIYNLEVYIVPTNKPMARKDWSDRIYINEDAKWNAIVEKVKELHKNGQPVLIGTTSIDNNETLSRRLLKAGIPHNVLNAKNHEKEAEIIAQAGRFGAVTVATNMAGRGVDIILGGNPVNKEEAQKVREVGGLFVIGTERHEARRIDNQLRGRAGRQGDPGSTQFFLSTEDELVRIFGGGKVKSLMMRFNFPENEPIENRFISNLMSNAQTKVEAYHFDTRKHLLEYDDVLNHHRIKVYGMRDELLSTTDEEKVFELLNLDKKAKEAFLAKKEELRDNFLPVLKLFSLQNFDVLWQMHLDEMDALRSSASLHAYGGEDPLSVYRVEGGRMFENLIGHWQDEVKNNFPKVKLVFQRRK